METTRKQFTDVVAINVDIQNDFCPGGALAVKEGDAVVQPMNAINRWVRSFQADGLTPLQQPGNVIFTADWHPEDTAHFSENGGPWPVHCVRHKAGAAFHNDLEIGDHDSIAHKGTGKKDDGYSGFFAQFTHESPLQTSGNGRGDFGAIDTVREYTLSKANVLYNRGEQLRKVAVIVGGLATDYCVKATVLDLLNAESSAPDQLGVYVVEDAIRAVDVNPGDGEQAIAEMKQAGATFVTAREILNGSVITIKEQTSCRR